MQPLSDAIKLPGSQECAQEILDATPPVMWFIRRQMRSHRGGLSLAQFRALVRVNRQPTASLSTVAEHLGASLPTASRIVAGLVDKGLATRHGCRWDRRQISLALTARGKAMLQEARKATQQRLETELNNLTPSDRNAVIQAMKILKNHFGPANGAGSSPSARNGQRR
jgi:DNA-binding MarR family transcriptional regulator